MMGARPAPALAEAPGAVTTLRTSASGRYITLSLRRRMNATPVLRRVMAMRQQLFFVNIGPWVDDWLVLGRLGQLMA
jgi:hypothetical protein